MTSPNRLINEQSPYLLQHAYNPVDWYPWGKEALTRAKSEQKPILLSVGYSACHWCHVMEHESFSDVTIATLMNAHFVCIKVDREERPDIDAIYMAAVQRMTGQGGWPMTLFLTPEGEPFYGGTYYPPHDRGQFPGFTRVLQSVHTAWVDRPDQLRTAASQLRDELVQLLKPHGSNDALSVQSLTTILPTLQQDFDSTHGGFGGAPKFPPAMVISFLLRHYQRTQSADALMMAEVTLAGMAAGGMYDHVGGGFARYSVDDHWEIPHFEKMLYDNALLLTAYSEAFQVTRNHRYAQICHEIVTWLTREMIHPDGGFFSALDADSEGEEGRYYAWSASELDALLGSDAALFRTAMRADQTPNFEGTYILHRRSNETAFCGALGITPAMLAECIERCAAKLLSVRQTRVAPQRDDKIIVAWNGLMIRALAQAGRIFGKPAWTALATRAFDFICTQMMPNGQLVRIWKDGVCGSTPAFLDDYAALANAALELYTSSANPLHLQFATQTANIILQRFYDAETQIVYDTSDTHEQLIVRPNDRTDNAVPSGNALTIDLLLRLDAIISEPYFTLVAEQLLGHSATLMQRWPQGFGKTLSGLEWFTNPVVQIVVAGTAGKLLTHTMAAMPLDAVVVYAQGNEHLLLCQNKTAINGGETLYICVNNHCELPVCDDATLQLQLARIFATQRL